MRLLSELGLKMESRAIEQGKMPDVVFKHRGQYYIFELKMMRKVAVAGRISRL